MGLHVLGCRVDILGTYCNGGGGRGRLIIYLSLHCHHQKSDSRCIKMGSDESHFNVSVGSDGQSHRTVSTNHNLFSEEKGDGRSGRGISRTEVLPLTNLSNVLPPRLGQTGSLKPINMVLNVHRNRTAY